MLNNSLLQELYEEIFKARYILVYTDENSSTDNLCASLALSNFLFENKVKHKVFNKSKNLVRRLNFLSKFDKITNTIPKYYDLIISFDMLNNEYQKADFPPNTKIISFANNFNSELVYSFLQLHNLKISKNIAECLYSGLYENSAGFTSSDTNSQTFKIASHLVNEGINVSQISDKLLKRESLAKFRCIPKIMNTLELFCEGKIATVCLYNSFIKETGAGINECDDVIELVLNIGLVDTVAYFRVIDDNILVSLKSKGLIDLSLYPDTVNCRRDRNTAELNISSSDIDSVKEKVVNTILNYI